MAKIMYRSSNKRIAKVTKKGVIKALKKGKCKINVKTSDGKKKVIIVKVK
ncbi:Ig-like domain-containing protein [Anaerobutyricum hallii]